VAHLRDEIEHLFEAFDYQDILYAVLRGYDLFIEDEDYSGKDMDICIKKVDLKRAKTVFLNCGYKPFSINPFSRHRGFAKFIAPARRFLFICVHPDGLSYINLRCFDHVHLLLDRRKNHSFYMPSYEDEFLSLLLHCILEDKTFKSLFRNRLTYLLGKDMDHEYIKKTLAGKIGLPYTEFILEQLFSNKFEPIESNVSQISKYFVNHYPKRRFELFVAYFINTFRHLSWFIKSKALISFIGMDGSGKTTVSKKVMDVLKSNNLRVKHLYGGRGKDNILPVESIRKRYWEKNGKNDGVSKKKDRNKHFFSLKYTISASIFTLDQVLRYLCRILPLRKTNHFVITDRWATDILLIKKVPMFLKRIMFFFVPKPTRLFYLFNDLDILSRRKKNHPVGDLEKQAKLFGEILPFMEPVKIKSEDLNTILDRVFIELFN